MNKDDFKKLLDESLEPIKKDLKGIKGEIVGVKGEIVGVKGEIVGVKGEIVGVKGEIGKIKETLEGHTQKLDALAGDVHDLQDQTKAIWDKVGMGHDRNKREIDEIKTRLRMPIMSDIPQT